MLNDSPPAQAAEVVLGGRVKGLILPSLVVPQNLSKDWINNTRAFDDTTGLQLRAKGHSPEGGSCLRLSQFSGPCRRGYTSAPSAKRWPQPVNQAPLSRLSPACAARADWDGRSRAAAPALQPRQQQRGGSSQPPPKIPLSSWRNRQRQQAGHC